MNRRVVADLVILSSVCWKGLVSPDFQCCTARTQPSVPFYILRSSAFWILHLYWGFLYLYIQFWTMKFASSHLVVYLLNGLLRSFLFCQCKILRVRWGQYRKLMKEELRHLSWYHWWCHKPTTTYWVRNNIVIVESAFLPNWERNFTFFSSCTGTITLLFTTIN